MVDATGACSPASSCCKANSLSPAHAAVMAKYSKDAAAIEDVFFHRRAARSPDGLRPRPGLSAREQRRLTRERRAWGRSPAVPARSSPAGRELLQTQCALLPHLWSCAPVDLRRNLRLRLNTPSVQHELSPNATSARSAAAGSRSARAQKNQLSAALAMAAGPCARIASIVWWAGRVSASPADVIASSRLARVSTLSGTIANARSSAAIASA